MCSFNDLLCTHSLPLYSRFQDLHSSGVFTFYIHSLRSFLSEFHVFQKHSPAIFIPCIPFLPEFHMFQNLHLQHSSSIPYSVLFTVRHPLAFKPPKFPTSFFFPTYNLKPLNLNNLYTSCLSSLIRFNNIEIIHSTLTCVLKRQHL